MKCQSCKIKIKKKESILVKVTDDAGKVTTEFHTCRDCGQVYVTLAALEKKYGTEAMVNIIKKVLGKKDEEC